MPDEYHLFMTPLKLSQKSVHLICRKIKITKYGTNGKEKQSNYKLKSSQKSTYRDKT